jgi:hypothetical protein
VARRYVGSVTVRTRCNKTREWTCVPSDRLVLCVGSEPHVLLVEPFDSTDERFDVTVASTEVRVALVKAPTGLTGFLLALRVSDSPRHNSQDVQGRWTVRVPVPSDAALRELVRKVQTWLLQERIEQTTVRVGGDVYRVGVKSSELAETDKDR